MSTVTDDMNDYLQETVGLKADVQFLPQKNMPVFISEQYSFCKLRVGGDKFLGVILRDPENFRSSSFEKHKRFFSLDEINQEIVLIADSLPIFSRKQLVEMKIPFIVPGVQLYWPELGFLFRSRVKGKSASQEIIESFDPSTQAVLIAALNRLYHGPITPKELSQRLYYSAMSMTRALDQIEAAGIGKIEKSGRQRFLSFPDNQKALWEKVKTKLNDPVRERARFWERDIPEECRLLAGESALSEVSMLVAPQTAIYAVGREKWKKIKQKSIPHLETNEPNTCEVQVWRYDPELFSNRKCVDVFSLYLSLQNNEDERVRMMLNEALEERL